jgi:hypothetical protein
MTRDGAVFWLLPGIDHGRTHGESVWKQLASKGHDIEDPSYCYRDANDSQLEYVHLHIWHRTVCQRVHHEVCARSDQGPGSSIQSSVAERQEDFGRSHVQLHMMDKRHVRIGNSTISLRVSTWTQISLQSWKLQSCLFQTVRTAL